MFHFYLTLAYTIPNIYVFFRINHLFIGKGYKLLYTLIYILLAAVYPLSRYLPGNEMNVAMQILDTVSGYLLPFYLYLFLSVLGYDLFLLLNRMVGVVTVETRKSLKYRLYLISALLLFSVAVVIGGVINLNNTRVSHYEITVPRKSSNLDKLRVAFVADFHIHSGLPVSFVEKYVQKVNELNPDLMFYGGDIVDDRKVHPELERITGLFRTIKSRFGVFGVLGNHEFYRGHTDGAFFKQAGIVLLNDSLAKIGQSFIVAGRLDEHFRNRKSVEEILGNNHPQLPVLMVDHRPTRFDEVIQFSVDAHFSGHTHNGQLFPINFIIKNMYELAWGYKKKKDTHFFVTSGLRLWGPPVKTAGKSEIMVVDITFE